MPTINIAVGKSKYEIDCPESEEENIRNLSAKVNERVNKLALSIRSSSEKTILMLCSVMMQEELDNLKSQSSQPQEKKLELVADNNSQNAIISDMEEFASRIENLANKIGNY